MEDAIESKSQSALVVALSRGRRHLQLDEILDRIQSDRHEAIKMTLQALAQNTWISKVDFTGVLSFGSHYHYQFNAQERAKSAASAALVTQLTSMLRANTSITELHLSGSELTPDEVQELVAALKCNASIN